MYTVTQIQWKIANNYILFLLFHALVLYPTGRVDENTIILYLCTVLVTYYLHIIGYVHLKRALLV